MTNITRDTARYQLDRFLNSENSHEYDLNSCDIALLNAICYYIDLEKDGRNACCAKRITLANRSRMNRDTANIHVQKLKDQGLIICERRWKLTWITLDNNLIKTVSPSLSKRASRLDQDVLTVTTIEEKKQNKRETTTEIDSFINDEELMDVPEVENFIQNLLQSGA